jgi:putative transposase
MGLRAIYPQPNLSQRRQEDKVYPYLLRNVTASYPNHVWGIDITYIVCGVVSWQLDDTLEMPFVLAAVEQALAQAKPVIWNSDQGSHFTSPQYTRRLLDADVQISPFLRKVEVMYGKGRAIDNIFTERFWRSLKYEEVYLHDYETPRQARHGLAAYLTFYNQKRLHQSLDYQTPAEVYAAPLPAPSPLSIVKEQEC